MRTGIVLFLAGVLFLCTFRELPPLWGAAGLVPAALLLRHRRLCLPAWFLCGFLWALLRAHLILAAGLDPSLEGQTLIAGGRIATLPAEYPGRVRFEFDIETLARPGGGEVPSPGRVRLGWYEDAPRLEPGERWRLAVRLKRPMGLRNPGGFDYEGWLFSRRIRATGYVAAGSNERLEAAAPGIDMVRMRLRDEVRRRFPDRPLSGLVTALVTGDQSGIPGEAWDILAATGTSHLMAISGMHIALVAGLAFALTRRAWPCLAGAALYVSAPRVAAVASIMAALAYAALAGFSVPTQRAVVMVTVGAIAAGWCRRAGMSEILAAALLAVLLFDPFAVLAAGFWLSFIAVAAIGLGQGGFARAAHWWARWGRVHWVVTVGVTPVLIAWFHQAPLLTIPANFVAVPWVSLVTVPASLLGGVLLPVFPAAGGWLLGVALWSLEFLWPTLELLAGVPGALMAVPASGRHALAAAGIGTLLLLMPRGFPARWTGIAWLLPFIVPASAQPAPGQWRLTVLDVGQGLAAVVKTRHHALLYDTGPALGPDFTAARAAVLPYLRHAGIRRINILVVSHGDGDHSGGVVDVLAGVPVDAILAGEPERVPRRDARACRDGMQWEWDGVEFRVLHPPPLARGRGNNRSCVLHVGNGRHALLLAGDIERDAEKGLVARHGGRLGAEVLVAPHHGSTTSSTEAFVKAVGAELVIFAAGYRNRYGFPKQDIIARYHQHGATILDTAASGAIDVQAGARGLDVRAFRPNTRRFWHSDP